MSRTFRAPYSQPYLVSSAPDEHARHAIPEGEALVAAPHTREIPLHHVCTDDARRRYAG